MTDSSSLTPSAGSRRSAMRVASRWRTSVSSTFANGPGDIQLDVAIRANHENRP